MRTSSTKKSSGTFEVLPLLRARALMTRKRFRRALRYTLKHEPYSTPLPEQLYASLLPEIDLPFDEERFPGQRRELLVFLEGKVAEADGGTSSPGCLSTYDLASWAIRSGDLGIMRATAIAVLREEATFTATEAITWELTHPDGSPLDEVYREDGKGPWLAKKCCGGSK